VKATDNGKAFLEALIAMNAKPIQPTVIDAEATADAGPHPDVPLAIESSNNGGE
jgi:hypothetical protein